MLCGACLREPPPWDVCLVWADYAYPWSTVIGRWKFAHQPALARHVAHWLRQHAAIAQAVDGADLLVPVPAAAARLRQRGYNPAAQLTRCLDPRRHAPWALARVREDAAPQSLLPRKDRLRNMRDVFTVPPPVRHRIQGRHVLLLDDVMTTGTTLREATRALQQAGVARVTAVCVARTAPN